MTRLLFSVAVIVYCLVAARAEARPLTDSELVAFLGAVDRADKFAAANDFSAGEKLCRDALAIAKAAENAGMQITALRCVLNVYGLQQRTMESCKTRAEVRALIPAARDELKQRRRDFEEKRDSARKRAASNPDDAAARNDAEKQARATQMVTNFIEQQDKVIYQPFESESAECRS
jgi:hypothetical protein